MAPPASSENPAGPDPAGLSDDQNPAPAEGTWWEGAVSGPPATQIPAELPAAAASGSRAHRARLAFRRWRRTRPFWGGLLITLGGGEILFTEKAPLGVVLHVGPQGLAGYLLPAMMILCGLLLWFAPAQRTFYGVLSVLLSLGTWLTSNLGGFLIGMLLGVVGGSLAFAWAPRAGDRPARRRKEKSKKNAGPARA